MNGGYFMIDCEGLDLIKGQTPQTIPGLYKRVQTAMKSNKPIFAVNCIWDTNGLVTPLNTFVIQFDGYVICTASTFQITITPSDVVTIVSMVG